jgi:hypothetical protein
MCPQRQKQPGRAGGCIAGAHSEIVSSMALKSRDLRLKIRGALQGKPAADQIRVIREYLADWPPNVRGEYVEMRRNLLARLRSLS